MLHVVDIRLYVLVFQIHASADISKENDYMYLEGKYVSDVPVPRATTVLVAPDFRFFFFFVCCRNTRTWTAEKGQIGGE